MKSIRILFVLPTLVLVACGMRVHKASVEKKNIDVIPVQSFATDSYEGSSLRLSSITMFLWKENFTGEQVRDVNIASEMLALSEVKNDELKADLDFIDHLKEQKDDCRREIKGIEKAIQTQQKAVAAAELQLAKAKEGTDADAIANAQVKLDGEKMRFDQLKANSETRSADLNARLATLTAQIEKETIDRKIEDRQKEIDQMNQTAYATIENTTEIYAMKQSQLGINFLNDGTAQVYIRGWDPNDGLGARTFTSFKKDTDVSGFEVDSSMDYESIQKIKYEPRGGKFNFVVYAGHGYSFQFDFARSDYFDRKGRINFSGNITRKRVGEPDRFGVIKLSNSKN